MKFEKYFNAGFDESYVRTIASKFDISPKVMEIIMSRGYETEEDIKDFLYGDNLSFYDPFLLSGMKEAVERINRAINENEKIVVFGDYDVDGISATAILVKMFEKFGKTVDTFLPNRFIDGYGITNSTIDKVINMYNPSLIITVDCGISCHDEIEYAKNRGLDVIVTDHHEIPEIIPETIVVNAKLPNQDYPFKELCGTGVALKLSQALLGYDKANEFLPIATIATIADIVSLTDENRLIVKKGLKLMDKFLPIGLKKLIAKNKINLKNLQASDIAFKIAPKINSSGRMGDANDSLVLYLENDINIIEKQIEKINAHNSRRQELCSKVYSDCKKMLAKKDISDFRCICLYSAEWDHGILGITCAKLVEDYNCPVFLFAKEGDTLKGSARSIKDINIHNILSSLQDILTTFGGHSVAAGLSLDVSKFDEFQKRVNSYIFKNINDSMFTPIKYYDCKISINDINDKFLRDLQLLEPCGLNNPKPMFLISTNNFSISILKNFKQHANITLDKKLQLIFFNYVDNATNLRLCNEHNFIIELNNETGKLYKGSIKAYKSGYEIDKKYSSLINAGKLYQISNEYKDVKSIEYSCYDETKLIEFLSKASTSVYGIAFVSYDFDKYQNFINNYDLSSIYNFELFNDYEFAPFNSLIICPQDFSWAKNFKEIVFLDQVYNSEFISHIQLYTKAKLFFPIKQNFNKNIFNQIDFSRQFFAQQFANLKKINNEKFLSIFELFNNFKRNNKISFANFYFIYLVFSQLGIIKISEIDGVKQLFINDEIKTNLNNSKLYSYCSFIKKIN